MTSQHNKAKRWRPWQFSIRALLLLTLVVGSYLGGWMSNEWKSQIDLERAKQQRLEAAQALSQQLQDLRIIDIRKKKDHDAFEETYQRFMKDFKPAPDDE